MRAAWRVEHGRLDEGTGRSRKTDRDGGAFGDPSLARPPRHVVGVGGQADPVAKIYGNRAGMLALRDQVDVALRADEGLASSGAYRETDERRYELFVLRAARCDGRAKGAGTAGLPDVHVGVRTGRLRRRRRNPGGPRLQAGRPGGDRGVRRGRLLLHEGTRGSYREIPHHAGHRQARTRRVSRRRMIPNSKPRTAAPWRSPKIFANIPAGRRRTWRGSRRPRFRIRGRPRRVAPQHTSPPRPRRGPRQADARRDAGHLSWPASLWQPYCARSDGEKARRLVALGLGGPPLGQHLAHPPPVAVAPIVR
jgi:hypothetical protein